MRTSTPFEDLSKRCRGNAKTEKESKKQKEKEDKPEAEEMRDAVLLSLRRKFIRI